MENKAQRDSLKRIWQLEDAIKRRLKMAVDIETQKKVLFFLLFWTLCPAIVKSHVNQNFPFHYIVLLKSGLQSINKFNRSIMKFFNGFLSTLWTILFIYLKKKKKLRHDRGAPLLKQSRIFCAKKKIKPYILLAFAATATVSNAPSENLKQVMASSWSLLATLDLKFLCSTSLLLIVFHKSR